MGEDGDEETSAGERQRPISPLSDLPAHTEEVTSQAFLKDTGEEIWGLKTSSHPFQEEPPGLGHATLVHTCRGGRRNFDVPPAPWEGPELEVDGRGGVGGVVSVCGWLTVWG